MQFWGTEIFQNGYIEMSYFIIRLVPCEKKNISQ